MTPWINAATVNVIDICKITKETFASIAKTKMIEVTEVTSRFLFIGI